MSWGFDRSNVIPKGNFIIRMDTNCGVINNNVDLTKLYLRLMIEVIAPSVLLWKVSVTIVR